MTTALIDAADSQPTVDPALFGKVATEALETLKQRTAARIGHRTVMDALIPFVETLSSSGSLEKAVEACKQGGKDTATMTAKLGRATYVGNREDKVMPPDPGAMAFVTVVEGLAKVIQ